jgi:hypothetical protein
MIKFETYEVENKLEIDRLLNEKYQEFKELLLDYTITCVPNYFTRPHSDSEIRTFINTFLVTIKYSLK